MITQAPSVRLARPHCRMTAEDLAVWAQLQKGRGLLWAALLARSIDQDRFDAQVMYEAARIKSTLTQVFATFEMIVNQETIQ